MPKPKYDHPVIQKGAVQVFAHLAQKPMSPELKEVRTPPVVAPTRVLEQVVGHCGLTKGARCPLFFVLACVVSPGTPNMDIGKRCFFR